MPYEVLVELKQEVLDAEGRAIAESLRRMGHPDLQNVKVSKRFVLDLGDQASQQKVEDIAREFLANPVSETFVVRKL